MTSGCRRSAVDVLPPAIYPGTRTGLNPEGAMLRVFSAFLLAALATTQLHAQDKDAQETRALIEKAVKAQGGLETLSREIAVVRKSKGKFYNDDFEFTGESYSDLKDRRKIVLRGMDDNGPSTRMLVMESDAKGWISFDGVSVELDAKFLERINKSVYCDRVAGLVTLLKN